MYINAASGCVCLCVCVCVGVGVLIYNSFRSATFYNDPPLITHAVAQELSR